MQVEEFKASELCSRKLLQLVNGSAGCRIDTVQLDQALKELARRRRHLEQLCPEEAAAPQPQSK